MQAVRNMLQRFAKSAPAGAGGELRISADVRAVVEGGSLVVLHVGRGILYKANSTGARVWQGLAGNRPRRSIAKDLSLEFGVPQEVVEKDIDEFVADLESNGLLDRRSLAR